MKWLDKLKGVATESPDPVTAPLQNPATLKQIQYIQNLISMWDPDSFQQYGGASQGALHGALDIAGVSDYDDVDYFSHLSSRQASQIIAELKEYKA